MITLNSSHQLISDFIHWQKFVYQHSFYKNQWYIVCPFGIGDTFLISALSKAILNRNGGKKVNLIVKKSHLGIPKLFDLNLGVIEYNHMKFSYIHNNFLRIGKPFIGHPNFIDHGILLKYLGYNHINLLDVYKVMFNIPHNTQIQLPNVKLNFTKHQLEKYIKMGIDKRRTVILAPEANTAFTINNRVWEQIAIKLSKLGWKILVMAKNNTSKIGNYPQIDFPLSEAISISEYAGWVISTRSGFCDLISYADCKLSVLYKNQDWYQGTLFEGCSLHSIYPSTLAKEYVIDKNDSIPILIKRVIDGYN